MSGDAGKLLLAELWERTSSRGNQYFSGCLGRNSLVLLRAGERDHPTKPGERVTVWNLIAQERDQDRRPKPETALAKRHRLAAEIAGLDAEAKSSTRERPARKRTSSETSDDDELNDPIDDLFEGATP